MPDLSCIAGIVLAGGKSSRMGRDKALLDFKGQPLLRHMMDLLHGLGIRDVFVSGRYEGYPGIEDDIQGAGPVQGITSVLKKKPDYKGYLFVPVDMPFLSEAALYLLLKQESGGYFINRPLPAYLAAPCAPYSQNSSVQEFLTAQGIPPIALPPDLECSMKNTNTPQEWEEALSIS